MPHRYDNNVNPDNHGDSGDGSRDSAMDLSDNKPMVVTATNLQEITSKLIEKVQGTISGAITAITSAKSRIA
jgi:hypothetical protein